MKLPYRVLGISSGNGVLTYALKENVIGNVECRSDYYIGGKPYQWDINYPGIPMMKVLPNYEKVDVVIGHPKCGMSSKFALSRGKKFGTHVGEESLDLFIEGIQKYNPLFFFMENLEKFTDSFPGEELESLFPNHYLVKIRGSVSRFGNSQLTRKRLVLVGIHLQIATQPVIRIFKKVPPEFRGELKTTAELLKDLPKNGRLTEDLDSVITMYSGYKISLREAQEFWQSNPHLRHWPAGGAMKTAPGVYINRENDYPLTVRKTNRQFNPQGIQMSPRELARIQGIPDCFLFYEDGNKTRSINKARTTVGSSPPFEISSWIRDRLTKFYKKYTI
jgi:site-specific DNA-cytosine methylase